MKTRAAIGTCAIVLVVLLRPLRCTSEPRTLECSGRAIRPSALSVGDVVFFRTTTWRGRLVRALQRSHDDFAHAGIVVSNTAGVQIAHACPDGTSEVRIDRLEDILTNARVTSVAIYRPKLPEPIAARGAAIAMEYARRKTPFDFDLALTDDEKVYCTELIWLSYRPAGLAIDNASDILFPGDLVRSGFFQGMPCGEALSSPPGPVLPDKRAPRIRGRASGAQKPCREAA